MRVRFGVLVLPALALSITGCSSSGVHAVPNSFAPAQLAPHAAQYRSLYSFKSGSNGEFPSGEMVALDGTLFGTTYRGGGTGCGGSGCGTVFKITPSGSESIVYRFKGGADGAGPAAGLTVNNGNLFGVTTAGGGKRCHERKGCGTVFKVTPAGKETVVYAFKGGNDGIQPSSELVKGNGPFFGTTVFGGGPHCELTCGTIFSVTGAGVEKVIYRFSGDYYAPNGLTLFKGRLYGSAALGGPSNSGMVFSITRGGALTTLSTGVDHPRGTLAPLNGKLYGVNYFSSKPCLHNEAGCGSIFAMAPNGNTKIVYEFENRGDGLNPTIAPINFRKALFGVTLQTVYRVTPAGTFETLYAFGGSPDGGSPAGGLTPLGGVLYGTTSVGGTGKCAAGCGTVYSIKP